jgi:hypothetical protein
LNSVSVVADDGVPDGRIACDDVSRTVGVSGAAPPFGSVAAARSVNLSHVHRGFDSEAAEAVRPPAVSRLASAVTDPVGEF